MAQSPKCASFFYPSHWAKIPQSSFRLGGIANFRIFVCFATEKGRIHSDVPHFLHSAHGGIPRRSCRLWGIAIFPLLSASRMETLGFGQLRCPPLAWARYHFASVAAGSCAKFSESFRQGRFRGSLAIAPNDGYNSASLFRGRTI